MNSGIALVKQIQEQGLKSLHMAVYHPIRPEFLAGAAARPMVSCGTPFFFDPGEQ